MTGAAEFDGTLLRVAGMSDGNGDAQMSRAA